MATNQISTSPYLLSDANQAAYRYNNELPPEEALEQQALNRRQHIANLLLQQGLSGAGANKGQMVGRFYVPGSPVQGLADLAKIGVGAYGTHLNDQSREALAAQNQQMLADAVANYKQATSDVPAIAGSAPAPVPQAAVADAMAPVQAMPVSAPASPPTAAPSVFNGQYQMGPDESGWEPKGPIQDLKATTMPAAQQQVAQAMVPQGPMQGPMQWPVPQASPGRPRTPEERKQALIDLMASQHPQARTLGTLLEQQQARQEERLADKEFREQQTSLDRDVRREGIASNTELRKSQIEATAMNTQALIDSRERMGQDANDLKKQLAGQQAELKKMEIQAAREAKQIGKTPPGYRATPEGNLEAIPGGPADTKLQGVLNQDTGILQSSTSDLDRLATIANEIKNHAGLKGITGLRGAIPNIPGTAAADAEAKLNSLKSQVAFSVLQTMRNNSKTGGALGNVSDAEGKRLEANLAALEKAQSYEQMKESLDKIIEFTDGAKGRLQSAFNMKHKGFEPPSPTPPSAGMTPTVPAFHDPEKQKRYEKFKQEHVP